MDMNKRIPCKRCSGRGFINWTFSEGNTGTATCCTCPECSGSGDIVVPMTNADRIRAMSDEELAVLLIGGCRGSKCNEQEQNEYGSVNCYQCRLKWLRQPAEEEQL